MVRARRAHRHSTRTRSTTLPKSSDILHVCPTLTLAPSSPWTASTADRSGVKPTEGVDRSFIIISSSNGTGLDDCLPPREAARDHEHGGRGAGWLAGGNIAATPRSSAATTVGSEHGDALSTPSSCRDAPEELDLDLLFGQHRVMNSAATSKTSARACAGRLRRWTRRGGCPNG